jgi:hypothetical protein
MSLFHHWKLDGDLVDEVGNNNLGGDEPFVTGIRLDGGQAVELTGAQTAFLAYSGNPNFTTSFSVSMFVKPDGAGTLASVWKGSTDERSWAIRLIGTSAPYELRAVFGSSDGTSVAGSEQAPGSVGVGTHHIVVTYDAGTCLLYVDGVEVGSTGSPPSSIPSVTDDFRIGALRDAAGALADNFDGVVDDIRVYDNAISKADVAVLYANGVSSVADATYNLAFGCSYRIDYHTDRPSHRPGEQEP